MKKNRVAIVGLTSNLGGTERVVSNYVTALSDRFAFDLLIDSAPSFAGFDAAGNRVIHIPAKRKRPLEYKIALTKYFTEEQDSIAAVWLNVNNLSNLDVLSYAKKFNINTRVIHAHNSQFLADGFRKILSEINRRKIPELATVKLACSHAAGDFFYGDEPYIVLPNAIPADKYAFEPEIRCHVRQELGLEKSHVIGTVGRLAAQKNQQFLIDLLPNILNRNPDSALVIVGGGPLEKDLKQRAAEQGVEHRVIFAGPQHNVSDFLSAFDVFAFPSLFEGLGLSLVEAQANDLPCIASDSIPDEAIVSKSVKRLACLDVDKWAEALASTNRQDFVGDEEAMRVYNLTDQAKTLALIFEGKAANRSSSDSSKRSCFKYS